MNLRSVTPRRRGSGLLDAVSQLCLRRATISARGLPFAVRACAPAVNTPVTSACHAVVRLREWSDKALMQIVVRDNNVDQALRALKKKLQREGVYREMKLRRHYEKPSEKRAREKAAAVRRARKLERKRAERDGVR